MWWLENVETIDLLNPKLQMSLMYVYIYIYDLLLIQYSLLNFKKKNEKEKEKVYGSICLWPHFDLPL